MSWALAIQAGIAGGGLLKGWWDNASRSAPPWLPAEITVPPDSDGTQIPIIFGRVRVQSPILAHITGAGALDVNIAQDTSVNVYHAAMLFVIGIPMAGHDNVKLHRLWVGDTVSNADFSFATAPAEPGLTDADEFLGGPGNGGGVSGKATIYKAGSNAPDMFLAGGAVSSDLPTPGYRGMVKLTLLGASTFASTAGNGWSIGESPTCDGYSFEVETYATDPAAPIYYRKIAGLVGANPAGVIHALLTDPMFIGFDEARLDLTSFDDVAGTLNDEGHTISLCAPGGSPAPDLIARVLDQIDGILYEDPYTGLLTLKLIRDDYTPGALDPLDESIMCAPPDIREGNWHQTINHLTMNYCDRSPSGGNIGELGQIYRDASRVAIDGANASMTGSIRRDEVSHPGICDAGLADQVVARELRTRCLPLKQISVTCHRVAAAWRPGDVKSLTSALDGIADMPVRIIDVDLGSLDDGRVRVHAVQDAFGVEAGMWSPPIVTGVGPETDYVDDSIPPPVAERHIEEAPRWLQLRAVEAGRIADADEQHLIYLAVPNEKDVGFRGVIVRTDEEGEELDQDCPRQAFSPRATVKTAYPRTAEPYDTTVDLEIENIGDWTMPEAATSAAAIRTFGARLIMIVSDEGSEIMAFESASGDVDTTVVLANVHRGLAGTVPLDHAIGARVYFLQEGGWSTASRRIGKHVLAIDTGVNARVVPRGASRGLAVEQCDADVIAINGRATSPAPASDFEINGEKDLTGDDQIIADGVALTWKRRDYRSVYLVRGDEADDAVSGEEFQPLAAAIRLAAAVLNPVELTTATVNGASSTVTLGVAGHGELAVSLRTERAADARESWVSPSIRVDAPHWRNLLRNGDFSDSTNGWTATSGTFSVGNTTATSLGNNGSGYAQRATGDPCTFRQSVDVSGYTDGTGMSARLSWYAHRNGDSNDTVAVTLECLDDDGSTVLATDTTAAYVPSANGWDRASANLAIVAGTTYLRVTFSLAGVGEAVPSSIIARVRLSLGIHTANQLNNPSFETGALSGWTTGSGSWRDAETTTPYELAAYIGGGAAATCTLYQETTVTAGHEGGSVALVEVAYARDAVTDTGSVLIEARNAAGTVLASDSVSVNPAASPLLTWGIARLALDLPYGTDRTRLTLTASRAAGAGNASITFDDARLTFHKELQVRWAADMSFSAPVTQHMPSTIARWWQDVTNVDGCPVPNAGFYDGTSPANMIQNGGTLEDGGVAYVTDAVFPWNGLTSLTNAIEFAAGCDLYKAASDPSYGFADKLACAAWIKVDPARWTAAAHGIVGRLHTDRGWSLELTSGGLVRAKLVGTLGTVTLDSAASVADGLPHFVAIRHSTATTTLNLIVDGVSQSTSTAAIGVVKSNPLPRVGFRVGRANTTQTVFPGQMARLYIWTGESRMPSAAQLAALWTHATDPSAQLDVDDPGINAADTVIAHVTTGLVVSEDSTNGNNYGSSLMRFKAGQVPIGSESLYVTGLASGPAVTARQPDALTSWTAQGSLTLATGVRDPEGLPNGLTITGTSAMYLRGSLDLSATADTRVSVWVYVTTTQDVKLELRNTSGTLIGSAVTTAVTGLAYWQRIDAAFTWDDSTANAYLYVYPSVDGTVRTFNVGHVLVHQDGAFYPTIWPAPLLGDQTMTAAVSWSLEEAITADPASRLGIEGEIYAYVATKGMISPAMAMTIATLTGTGDDGRRTLRVDAAGDLFFDAGNASGTVITSEVSPSDTNWRGGVYPIGTSVRGQWSRAGLVHNGAFAGLWLGANVLADNDVASAITHELTTPVSRFVIGPFVGYISRVVLRTREEERWEP